MKPKLVRIDKLLVDKKLVDSRALAQSYIEAGRVFVDGQMATKSASQASSEAKIVIDAPEKTWVSRGAYKLIKALDFFGIDPSGKICMDIGASTGGFTEVLLSREAKLVYAVDVGYGQLAWKLRTDRRVVVMERTNARFLTQDMIGEEKADIIVSDVSFISLKLLLKPLQELLKPDGRMVVLVKPQFEVGKEHVGKGVVSDPSLHASVINCLSEFIENETKMELLGKTFSPIRGPEGNIEFLFFLGIKGCRINAPQADDTEKLVAEAHTMTASVRENERGSVDHAGK